MTLEDNLSEFGKKLDEMIRTLGGMLNENADLSSPTDAEPYHRWHDGYKKLQKLFQELEDARTTVQQALDDFENGGFIGGE